MMLVLISHQKMLEIAKIKSPQSEFINHDIVDIKFNNNHFDGVFCAFVLSHIPKKDVKKCLSNLKNILKNNGIIFIAIQEGESKEIEIPEPFDPSLSLFMNIMSKDELKSSLINSGFDIIDEHMIQSPKTIGSLDFNKYSIFAKNVK